MSLADDFLDIINNPDNDDPDTDDEMMQSQLQLPDSKAPHPDENQVIMTITDGLKEPKEVTLKSIKEEEQQKIFIEPEEVQYTKSGKKKKPLSDKQKAHLDRIRLKSLENKKQRRADKMLLENEKNDALAEKRRIKELHKQDDTDKRVLERLQSQASQSIPPSTPPASHSGGIDYDRINGMINQSMSNHFKTYETNQDKKKQVLLEKLRAEEDKKKQVKFQNYQSLIDPNRFNSVI